MAKWKVILAGKNGSYKGKSLTKAMKKAQQDPADMSEDSNGHIWMEGHINKNGNLVATFDYNLTKKKWRLTLCV